MFDDDICLCRNSYKCPNKEKCKRAEHKVGIHTYSNFYEEDKECEYFWKKEIRRE